MEVGGNIVDVASDCAETQGGQFCNGVEVQDRLVEETLKIGDGTWQSSVQSIWRCLCVGSI